MSATKPIEIDHELAKLLKQAAESGKPLTVSSGEESFDITVLPTVNQEMVDPWEDYDPEKLRSAVANAAGIFTEEEGAMLIKQIREAREAGSRPPTRP